MTNNLIAFLSILILLTTNHGCQATGFSDQTPGIQVAIIVGITLGGLLVVTVITLIIVFCCCCKNGEKSRNESPTTHVSSPPSSMSQPPIAHARSSTYAPPNLYRESLPSSITTLSNSNFPGQSHRQTSPFPQFTSSSQLHQHNSSNASASASNAAAWYNSDSAFAAASHGSPPPLHNHFSSELNNKRLSLAVQSSSHSIAYPVAYTSGIANGANNVGLRHSYAAPLPGEIYTRNNHHHRPQPLHIPSAIHHQPKPLGLPREQISYPTPIINTANQSSGNKDISASRTSLNLHPNRIPLPGLAPIMPIEKINPAYEGSDEEKESSFNPRYSPTKYSNLPSSPTRREAVVEEPARVSVSSEVYRLEGRQITNEAFNFLDEIIAEDDAEP